MRIYELTVVVHPDLEMNLEPATNKVEKLISENGGKIVKLDDEGKKKTAYRLEEQDFAIYLFYDVELPTEAISKISNALEIAEEYLRYLIVKKDDKKIRYEARRKEREAEEAALAAAEAEGATEETGEASEEISEEASADKDNKEE